jgi:hypothetical protein
MHFWIDAGSTYSGGTFPEVWQARTTNQRVYDPTGWLEDTTSREFYLTGVQLTVGDVDLPFIHESYGETLQKCRRYFETNYPIDKYPGDVVGNTIGAGLTYRTGSAATEYDTHPFKVRKRTNPTVVVYNGLDGGTGDWRGSSSTDFSVTLYDNEESFTAQINDSNSLIRSGFYTADAEL